MSVADYLGHGAENAIGAATLAAVTHTTPRELRRLIMDERKRGASSAWMREKHQRLVHMMIWNFPQRIIPP